MIKLNILHLLALAGALSAAWAVRREARGRSLTPGQLFIAPACALGTALMLLALTSFEWRHPSLWLGALGGGLLVGMVRGFLAPLEVDRLWDRIYLGRARESLWIGSLVGAVAVAALAVDLLEPAAVGVLDLSGNMVTALCAGFLAGRAAVLWLRSLAAPHANFPAH